MRWRKEIKKQRQKYERGQRSYRTAVLIFSFCCVENALLSPLPKVFMIVYHKDKRHVGFLLFCFVFVEIKERIQIPHVLGYQGRDGQKELSVRINMQSKIVLQWRESEGMRGEPADAWQRVRDCLYNCARFGDNPQGPKQLELQLMPRIHRTWGSLGLTIDSRMMAVVSRIVPDSICALGVWWKQAWRERRLKAGRPVREASMWGHLQNHP